MAKNTQNAFGSKDPGSNFADRVGRLIQKNLAGALSTIRSLYTHDSPHAPMDLSQRPVSRAWKLDPGAHEKLSTDKMHHAVNKKRQAQGIGRPLDSGGDKSGQYSYAKGKGGFFK